MGSRRMPSAGARSGNSPRVQLTLKSLRTLESQGAGFGDGEVPAVSKKAAQKLTNFRAYLHKSSVAACFVDLLEMTSDGIMTESGLYPSSLYKKSRSLRRGGLSPSRRPRTPGGLSSGLQVPSSPRAERPASDDAHAATIGAKKDSNRTSPRTQGRHRRRRRRPSTAVESHAPTLAQIRDIPTTSRVPARHVAAPTNSVVDRTSSHDRRQFLRGGGGGLAGAGGGGVTTLDIQRTQWVEEDGGGGEGKQDSGETRGGPETDDSQPEMEAGYGGGGGRVEGEGGATPRSRWGAVVAPRAKVAWGDAKKDLSLTVSKVVQMQTAAHRKKGRRSTGEQRLARAASLRAQLIEMERQKAKEVLSRNDDRKRAALQAAAVVASQRGLMEAIMIVVAAKRIWTRGLKLSVQRGTEARQVEAARIIERAYKAYSSRRIFKVLLSIRRIHLRLHIGISIRRKSLATTKIRWFLTTGSGGANARPRKVIKHFMYQVTCCQRAAREWLACRSASIEVICRLWDRIEVEIRRHLGDELDRAKRLWMKNAILSGEDSHVHGQWRELKAKTRSLVARIDRLEVMIDRQHNGDRVHQALTAKAMLKRRPPPGLDGAPRGKRLAQVDSADDLRSSTVASARRLAVIRSNLSTKFALHLQGGHRVTRAGKRVVGEMDARLLIQGDLHGVADTGGDGLAGHSTKRSRALIYTGDLGRPWEQIVEDAVMQDFQRTAFTRKDSMPYLQYSPILSPDMLAATGSVQRPSAAIARATGSTNTIGGSSGRGKSGGNSPAVFTPSMATDGRRSRRQTRSSGVSGASIALPRRVLQPIL